MLNSIEELENIAKKKLELSIYDFIKGGAGTEWAVQNNRNAFQNYQFVPRVLQNINMVDTSTQIFGISISSPIIIGPSAFHKLVCAEGEILTARAAKKIDTILTLSTMSSCSIEEVAAENKINKWFQLYIFKNKDLTEDLVRRAEKAGYKAIIVTVDVPAMGIRQRDIRNNFALPMNVEAANFKNNTLSFSTKTNGSKIKEETDQQFESNLTWELIDWLSSVTKLPIVLKGILSPDDAQEALKHQIAGIIVSNHGGRQLDSVISGIDALPAISEIIQKRIPLFVDGGVRSGEDVFKAIALGADAVLIARPVLWSLAIGGEKELISTFKTLQNELSLTMRLMGCYSIQSIKEKGLSLLASSVYPPKILTVQKCANQVEEQDLRKLTLFK